MIFQHTWQQVLDGSKTATRRPVKETEWAELSSYNLFGVRVENRTIHAVHYISNNGIKWQLGSTYAVQPGRGQKSVARIKLTGIRREPVNAITEEDAVAEGFGARCNTCGAQGWVYREVRTNETIYLDRAMCNHCDGNGWIADRHPVEAFAATWDRIHGAGSFDSSVEVWVLEFQLVGAG